MWHKKLAVITAAVFTLAGCAASDYPARPAVIEQVVNTDVNAAWDALVAGLEGRDFQINNLAKDDRTIRVVVKSHTPSQFVDCGEISVRSKHPEFGERNYNFEAANSTRYLVADERADELVDVERRTSLNAVASIRLTPISQGTLVQVATHYVMNFRTREFGTNIAARSLDDSLKFDNLGRASLDEEIRQGATMKTVKVECQPTGELERRIADLLTKAAG